MKKWYALYTRPRHEKKAFEFLVEKNETTFLPLIQSVKNIRNRKLLVELPLFPSYIFCHFDYKDRFNILQTHGIIKIVSFKGVPAVVPDWQIDSLKKILENPKSLRMEETFQYMQKTGVDALPIVGMISFLLGLIVAFMSSVQLQLFGANIYVASLVSLAMVRELGPIMTAIIVAGRSGSAFAAEIGTMKVSEEIDALFTMGFDPTRFLVVPKIVATVIVVPFLTLFSDLFAILGGLVVGVFMLDLTTNAYISQTIKTLTVFDIGRGFLKSGVFALLITVVGCLRGFQVMGGAASVGQATTSAVVTSIFLIILSDSIFAVILRYWG